jgi:ribosome assembly protein 1
VLRKHLFEDFAFNSATNKLVKCNPTDHPNVKPMFASMILDPIWQMYEVCISQSNPEKAAKMAKRALGIEISAREINTRDPRITIQAILRRWLPLSDTVLRMVVRCMPSPLEAQRKRHSVLLRLIEDARPEQINKLEDFDSNFLEEDHDIKLQTRTDILESIKSIEKAVVDCNASQNAPLLVFISKMAPIRVSELAPRDIEMVSRKITEDSSSRSLDAETFLAIGRVYSGTLTRDCELFVIGHRHDPFIYKNCSLSSTDEEVTGFESIQIAKVPASSIGLYIMLGPSISPTDSAPAGNIVGIVGLEEIVLKTATLCNTWGNKIILIF